MKKKDKKTVEELIEGLVVMTQKGFEEVSGRFDGVEGRLGKIEGEMKEVVKRLDRIEYGMISHERRLSILEDKMRIVSVKLGLKR